MGRVYYLDVDNSCIDPEPELLDILHIIGEDITLHTSKESLLELARHPLVYGRLVDEFGEVVTWTNLEKHLGIVFKYHPKWTRGVFTPYRGSVPTGDLIVLK